MMEEQYTIHGVIVEGFLAAIVENKTGYRFNSPYRYGTIPESYHPKERDDLWKAGYSLGLSVLRLHFGEFKK